MRIESGRDKGTIFIIFQTLDSEGMDLGRDKDSGKGAMNLSSRPASAATEHHSDGDVSEVRKYKR